MPDISTLLEKETKKKFKKSSYRPWNYLDEMEKEKSEKIEESTLPEPTSEVTIPPKTLEVTALTPKPSVINEPSADILNTSDRVDIKYISQDKNLLNQEDAKKENNSSPLYKILRLSGHQKIIFALIFEKCLTRGSLSSGIITGEYLVSITQTTLKMVNTSIQRLVNKQLIYRADGKRGRGGFYCFYINEAVKEAAIEYKRLTPDALNKKPEEIYVEDNNFSKLPETNYENAASIDLENIDIDPLKNIGFTKGHLTQLYRQGKLDLNTIQDSINYFAYDLEFNNKATEIKKNPMGYFMGILIRAGVYNPPENYESRKDRSLRLFLEHKKNEKEKREKMLKELSAISFDEWQAQLTSEEKDKLIPQEIKNGRLKGAIIAWLKTYFMENIWPTLETNNM